MTDNDLRDLFFGAPADVQQEILARLVGTSVIHTALVNLLMEKEIITRDEVRKLVAEGEAATWGLVDGWVVRSKLL